MKRVIVFVWTATLFFGVVGIANATLSDLGDGIIYDSDQNIMWLQDANFAVTQLSDAYVDEIIAAVGSIDGHVLTNEDFRHYIDIQAGTYSGLMSWYGAMAWVDQLEYGGYDDWRLPTTVDGVYSNGYDGTTTAGYNITTSEMGYMYYEVLGNLGYIATDGTSPQSGWDQKNSGPFNNLMPYPYSNYSPNYWSSTEHAAYPGSAWQFTFYTGSQYNKNQLGHHFAWAVRPVPEPATMFLLGSGLIGLVGFRRKIRRS